MSPQKTATSCLMQKQRKWSQSSPTASSPRWLSLKYLKKEIHFTSHVWKCRIVFCDTHLVDHNPMFAVRIQYLKNILGPYWSSPRLDIWNISWAQKWSSPRYSMSETILVLSSVHIGAHRDIQSLKRYKSLVHIGAVNNIWYQKQSLSPKF